MIKPENVSKYFGCPHVLMDVNLEEDTPDEFFENPSNERLRQFLGRIIRK